MPDAGYQIPDTRYQIQDAGCRLHGYLINHYHCEQSEVISQILRLLFRLRLVCTDVVYLPFAKFLLIQVTALRT